MGRGQSPAGLSGLDRACQVGMSLWSSASCTAAPTSLFAVVTDSLIVAINLSYDTYTVGVQAEAE